MQVTLPSENERMLLLHSGMFYSLYTDECPSMPYGHVSNFKLDRAGAISAARTMAERHKRTFYVYSIMRNQVIYTT